MHKEARGAKGGPGGGDGVGGGVERRDHFSVSKHNHHLLFEDIKLLLDE